MSCLQAIPLIDTPVEVGHRLDVTDVPGYGSQRVTRGHHEIGGGPGGITTDSRHMYMHYQKLHEDYLGGGVATGQRRFHSQSKFGAFDGMALSEDFLGDYFIRVSTHCINGSTKTDGSILSDTNVIVFFVDRNPATPHSRDNRRTLCWSMTMRVGGPRQVLWVAVAFMKTTMTFRSSMILGPNLKPWLRSVGDQPW